MKKINVLLVILLAMFLFAACASNEDDTDESNNGNDSESNDGGDNNGESNDGGETGDTEITDADQKPSDGFYVTCTPGETRPCYEGPSGTEGVGICKAGVATCVEDGTDWSECVGQVTPQAEICSNGIDENCDGEDMTPENAIDYDGDGYNYCTGDCCETAWEPGCSGTDSPERINPGAYEMSDDGLDNNCNGQIDEPEEQCDAAIAPLAVGDYDGNAVKLAQAMGICTGLISAKLSLAGDPVTEEIDARPDRCDQPNGQGGTTCTTEKSPRPSREMPYYESDYQTFATTDHFGGIVPVDGSSKIAVLSTGQWDSPTMNPQIATLGAGDMQTASKIPEDWINMMANCEIPKAPSCGGQPLQDGLTNQCAGKEIPVGQDPIMLTLKIKAPINAEAFEFNLFFMSIEYPGTVCNEYNYNDFFIALLDSTYNEKNPGAEYMNPYDKNLAKDEFGNPVGVDLAPAGLFKACKADCTNGVNKYKSCTGEEMLIGTGFEAGDTSWMNPTPCMSGHGGTGWLRVAGNIVPNEEFTIRLALWEQGEVNYGPDHSYDSTVVLDGFKWLPRPGKPGVSPK